MATYKQLGEFAERFVPRHTLFKYGFNFSPMYRRSTGKILSVSEDLMQVRLKVPISMKNRNYVGSIFGGSMFSAVDPIPMVQLINLIGEAYVVWDKSATIYFKRPAREHLFANFEYTIDELDSIRKRVAAEKEIEIIKSTDLTNAGGDTIFCRVEKKLYIADKTYFKDKRKKKQPN